MMLEVFPPQKSASVVSYRATIHLDSGDRVDLCASVSRRLHDGIIASARRWLRDHVRMGGGLTPDAIAGCADCNGAFNATARHVATMLQTRCYEDNYLTFLAEAAESSDPSIWSLDPNVAWAAQVLSDDPATPPVDPMAARLLELSQAPCHGRLDWTFDDWWSAPHTMVTDVGAAALDCIGQSGRHRRRARPGIANVLRKFDDVLENYG